MSATATERFPACGVLPAAEQEALARKLVIVLEGCATIEDLVGTCPTRFGDAVESIVWRLYREVWPDYAPPTIEGPPEGTVARWIADEAYGGKSWYQDARADEAVAS